ncbi:MAG: hypothetical protein QOJ96_2561 [Alphaproteobacteria bacterium]|jgi:hypothetical protein|nr:hypothetical protein [Alphaproteobacteria bacterium]
MTKTLKEALSDLKKLGAKSNLSPAEKDILQHVNSALQAVDGRLAALEGEDHSASAPISDTPQGETAPMSR